MTNETETEYKFAESKVAIKTEKGLLYYPCYKTKYAPGLCILSAKTVFSITHVTTGLNVGGEYERFGNAAINLAELQQVANKYGFSWESNQDELDAIRSSNKDLAMDIAMCRVVKDSSDEFPYEDDHPLNVAIEMLERETANDAVNIPENIPEAEHDMREQSS